MEQKELAAALKKAKGGTPHRFVLVGKMNAPKLALARTKIPSKLIAELRAETGGSILLQGTCVGEDGDLVFSAAKNAKPSFAPILKRPSRTRRRCQSPVRSAKPGRIRKKRKTAKKPLPPNPQPRPDRMLPTPRSWPPS